MRLYGLSPDLAWLRWRMGPDLVEWLAAGPELPYDVADDVPRSGLDLDPATRRAGLWTLEPLCGLREQWAELWPGWTLEFWEDDLARQAAHDPDRLYDSVTPRVIAHHRHGLAERVRRYWPVRSTMQAGGADVDWLYEHDSAGVRSHFDANITADEIEHAAQLLRGPLA
ncbi:hypothetical protein ACFQZ4_08580 [Catellatospora coxensis]